jgi:hypothetical protein
VGTDAARRRQYLYHQAWRQERAEEKFDRVLEMSERLAAWRTEVRRDLGTRVWAAPGCWPRSVMTVLGSVTLESSCLHRISPGHPSVRAKHRRHAAQSEKSASGRGRLRLDVRRAYCFAAGSSALRPPPSDRGRPLRNMFNRFLSQLHHCPATGQKFDPEWAFPTHHDRVAA